MTALENILDLHNSSSQANTRYPEYLESEYPGYLEGEYLQYLESEYPGYLESEYPREWRQEQILTLQEVAL